MHFYVVEADVIGRTYYIQFSEFCLWECDYVLTAAIVEYLFY